MWSSPYAGLLGEHVRWGRQKTCWTRIGRKKRLDINRWENYAFSAWFALFCEDRRFTELEWLDSNGREDRFLSVRFFYYWTEAVRESPFRLTYVLSAKPRDLLVCVISPGRPWGEDIGRGQKRESSSSCLESAVSDFPRTLLRSALFWSRLSDGPECHNKNYKWY